MLNERLAAARPIANGLKCAESTLNESVRQIGTLLISIADARDAKGTRFALDAGVAASEKIALAAVSAINSYKMMVEAHNHFALDRQDAGLATVMFGDNYCPVEGKLEASPPLRVVGD